MNEALVYMNELLEELRVLGFDYSIDEYGTCSNIMGDAIFEADTLGEINGELEGMIDEIKLSITLSWRD